MTNSFLVKKCKMKHKEILSQFAYRINNMIEHSSAFCYKSLEAIQQDFESSLASNSAAGCWQENKLIGILICYIDQTKNNTDCSLLIEPGVCYEDVANELFHFMRNQLNPNMRYTFFFPKENSECIAFLDIIGAHREVNEYVLLLKRGNENIKPTPFVISDLPIDHYPQFEKLHDNIFPGVYISGKDIINDIGKKHFVFTIMDNDQILAYSVLRLNGSKRATAELVAVREGYRQKGYGRAILAHLITRAFEEYGMDRVDLIVDGDNETAIRLYLDLGFIVETENCCCIVS